MAAEKVVAAFLLPVSTIISVYFVVAILRVASTKSSIKRVAQMI